MWSFLSSMWGWLPAPLPIIFYAMLIFLVLWTLVSIVIAIIDLIPFT